MFCKYCGKPITDDSLFCKHCGRNIEDGIRSFSTITVPKIDVNHITNKIVEGKNTAITFLKQKAIFTWKVIKTIFLVIAGIIVYIATGFIMAPLMAMFNADFPDLGIFSMIEDIWKKEEKPKEESNTPELPNT